MSKQFQWYVFKGTVLRESEYHIMASSKNAAMKRAANSDYDHRIDGVVIERDINKEPVA